MSRLKVGVIGVGTMGAQVLWQLSKRGVDAVGFEPYAPGHPRGAAGGESRLFRNIELEDLRYSPIVARADELWRDLESESGRVLRLLEGAIVMGSPAHEQMQNALRAVEHTEHPYEILDETELNRRYPAFAVDPGDIGIVDHTGGIIRPELTVATAARVAVANGAIIHRNTPVLDVAEDGSDVWITTASGRERFDRVVVTAGGWTSHLLPRMEPMFQVRRLISAWFFGREAQYLDRVLPFIRTEPGYCYGLPVADRSAMKIGLGFANHLVVDHADSVERRVHPDEIEPFRRIIERYMPGLDSDPMRTETYIESYTPDRHEFISEHPDLHNIIVMSGFSGHGFKMAPAVGEIGAQLALDGTTALDIEFLRHRGEL
ncbi:N-methyl-L-tryptophan oxidase [Cryobacterium sp. TMT1-3]|uniref:N-methyl-L-tryptophan oxidase n=1 Tax=Cryobacterium sp. TMT1-3 TaxID=1259237 RepID=UPI00106BC688|nr:N-methyl-L-tryptophan oxidase [Cryobacterium sp. TMT1-3]TFC28586.1 N-methyl-L-tryptophan oxidase [Cryobacterium sp. TMT1-3]